MNQELTPIIKGLREAVVKSCGAIADIAAIINDYADFLEYLANQEEIDHSLNYAIREGYLDPDGLDTPQQKLKAWKKLEADSIRGEMMAEDEHYDYEIDKAA